jgi:hypothetical protein
MKYLKKYKIFESSKPIIYKGYNDNVWYHATPSENIENINKNGLTPVSSGNQWKDNEYPKGIYLFGDKDDAILYSAINLGIGDVYEVNTEGITLYDDPEDKEDSEFEDSTSVYTTENIPLSKIKLIPMSDDEKEELWRQYESGELLNR